MKLKKLYHGAAYYPELWDKAEIDKDIEYMKEAGINVVRMGEFAWSTMEKEEGKIDVSFFVEVVNKLYENGIETIFCTPTPTPPIWVSHNHPERMIKNTDGVILSHGGRQQVCINNPYLRQRAEIIIHALGKAFKGNPGVIAWQLDNELKANVYECCCDSCKEQWHQWLKEKYKTIENLNQAWGTAIWSEEYQDFSQVVQPLPTPMLHNASLSSEYRMFSREKVNEYAKMQADILRQYSDAPITHNVHTNFMLDNEGLFKHLDFTSFDEYTDWDFYQKWLLDFDLFRGMKQDKQFFVMETSPLHSGWLKGVPKAHKKGFLLAEAASAYANGGMGFSYWLFRGQRAGCEIPHSSLLYPWGEPTLGFDEAKTVEEFRKIAEKAYMATEHKQPEVAMTYSDRARAFWFTEPLLEGKEYTERMLQLHMLVDALGINRDLLGENATLDGYKMLITPFMPYVSDKYIEEALKLVKRGGVWIIGPFTGHRTQYHTTNTDCALSRLEEIAGVKVKHFYNISASSAQGEYAGVSAPLSMHSCVFECLKAKPVAYTKGGLTPDMPYITEMQVGDGLVVMLGSLPAGETGDLQLMRLFDHYAKRANVNDRYEASRGTIVVTREGSGEYKRVYTAINMDGEGGEFMLPEDGVNIVTGEALQKGKYRLREYGYAIIAVKN